MILEELLSKKEGKTLEFKENSQSLQKIIQTIIAYCRLKTLNVNPFNPMGSIPALTNLKTIPSVNLRIVKLIG